MARWVGIAVAGEKITLVDAEVAGGQAIKIVADQTIKLQSGNRATAYCTLHNHVADYLNNNDIEQVVIKASAVPLGKAGKSLLAAAELRGVIMAAAASATKVVVTAKAQISKSFGDRKFDEYIKDDKFWTTAVSGISLRSGSREAALLLLSEND